MVAAEGSSDSSACLSLSKPFSNISQFLSLLECEEAALEVHQLSLLPEHTSLRVRHFSQLARL